MRRLLQSMIFNRRTYNRPHDEWVCGRACEGCPCVLGPDAKGQCRATGECIPAQRGDRWFCTRSEALGGPCTSGPLPDGACGQPVTPCVPQRSLRSTRGQWVLLAAGAALGIVTIALSGRNRTAWISPGPLTAHHATSALRCADCHLEAAGLKLSPAAIKANRLAENQLCLNCHDLGTHSALPHGSESIARAGAATPGQAGGPMALVMAHALVPGGGHAELACATCHQEHHGRTFNLAKLTDQQCQSCHAAQFVSFTSGHPEFAGYPFKRRTRIQFDHASHLQKHFIEPGFAASAPTTCSTCHENAADGTRMLVRGFAQTCAKCHEGQIEGEGRSGAKGVAFFRLPGVDIAALTAAGEAVGEWPKFAEGGLTPFMRWLLDGNPDARAALVTLGKVGLEDLAGATATQKAAAARVVWSLKNLLADLVTQGQPVLLQRMTADGGARSATMARTGQFSADGLLAAQQVWLPHLLEEVADFRRGKMPPLPPPAAKPLTPVASPPAAKSGAGTSSDLLGDDLPAPATSAPAAAAPKPVGDDDLLAGSPAPAKATASDDLLAEAPSTPAATAAVASPPAPALAMADTEQRAAAGGWYRNDDTDTIYYRPTGHADPFLVAWIDATAGGSSAASREIFGALTEATAPGLCSKCHSIDETNGTTLVNWSAARATSNQHGFNRFNHASHFSVAAVRGCQTCHALDAKADYAKAFAPNRDPAIFHSGFAAISRATCAACHTAEIAGANCLQCHNYHTGTFETQMRLAPAPGKMRL